MISFENKEKLQEWIIGVKNNTTLLEAALKCEERQCRIVVKSTDGFRFKSDAVERAEAVKNCADMVLQYLK